MGERLRVVSSANGVSQTDRKKRELRSRCTSENDDDDNDSGGQIRVCGCPSDPVDLADVRTEGLSKRRR
jgi:hypothetical protein